MLVGPVVKHDSEGGWRRDVLYTEVIYPLLIPLHLGTSLYSGTLLKTNSSVVFRVWVSLLHTHTHTHTHIAAADWDT